QGVSEKVLDHELHLTRALLYESSPRVIVAVGKHAVWGLRRVATQLAEQVSQNYRMNDLQCKSFVVAFEGQSAVTVVVSQHLTGSFGFSSERLTAVGEALRLALTTTAY